MRFRAFPLLEITAYGNASTPKPKKGVPGAANHAGAGMTTSVHKDMGAGFAALLTHFVQRLIEEPGKCHTQAMEGPLKAPGASPPHSPRADRASGSRPRKEQMETPKPATPTNIP